MDIFEHPGNLGSARGTLLTIHHGDWPAYPQGDNFYTPLIQLTAFPPGTEFVVVDDMDQSFLLVADVEGKELKDCYDERHFHIAVWHEDLREMHEREMVDGVEPVSHRRWYEEFWRRTREGLPEGATLYYEGDDGEKVQVPEPNFDEYDDDFIEYVICSSRRLRVTNSGRETLLTELRTNWNELREGVGERTTHLFELGYFDTSIREACVQLEDEIKKYLGSKKWGNQLAEEFIIKLRDEKKILESHLRTYRQELRTVFKFVRNDYMHNLRDADEAAAYAMLFRIARARSMLAEARP
jgi:hypothetical protein